MTTLHEQIEELKTTREAFEHWMINVAKIIVGSNDPYPKGLERDYWRVWQAAADAKAHELAEEIAALQQTIVAKDARIELFTTLYEECREVMRYDGVDQFRFNNALRGMWETVGELQKYFESYDSDLSALAAHDEKKLQELIEPTKEMIEAGAQRLARWDDGCTWPDSWGPLQVAGMRKDAERVWRSMILEALKRDG